MARQCTESSFFLNRPVCSSPHARKGPYVQACILRLLVACVSSLYNPAYLPLAWNCCPEQCDMATLPLNAVSASLLFDLTWAEWFVNKGFCACVVGLPVQNCFPKVVEVAMRWDEDKKRNMFTHGYKQKLSETSTEVGDMREMLYHDVLYDIQTFNYVQGKQCVKHEAVLNAVYSTEC